MKNAFHRILSLVFPVLIILVAGGAPARAWDWASPLPQANTLFSVFFVDNMTGYAAGENGTIIKTTDGGSSWTIQDTGVTDNLRDIEFRDSNTGFAVGYGGVFLKTTDGGSTWDAYDTGAYYALFSVKFPDDGMTGYAVGAGAGNIGLVYKTTDGGSNWDLFATTTHELYDFVFPVNGTAGFAVGGYETKAKTTDGGATWDEQYTTNYISMEAVDFPTDNITGYIVGVEGKILKTIDGGANWTEQTSGTSHNLFRVDFPEDSSTGYVIGLEGVILKTTDGGANWVSLDSGTTDYFYDAHFPQDSSTGYVVGRLGIIMKTTDGGATWTELSSPDLRTDLNASDFPVGVNTGYAVSRLGEIIKTTDGGDSWTTQTSGVTEELRAVHFPVDDETGYVVGWNDTILKTTNGGTTWVDFSPALSKDYYDVYFPADTETGYIAGGYAVSCGLFCTNDYYTIMKTTDGGSTWTEKTTDEGALLKSIFFPDSSTGYAVGNSGLILKTTDAGETWSAQTSGTTAYLTDVYFLEDALTGYAVGTSKTFLKTTDGGSNWSVSTLSIDDSPVAVYFAPDGMTGYIAGGHGLVVKTTDGGTSWEKVFGASSYITIKSIEFPADESTGFAAGGFFSGTLMSSVAVVLKEGAGFSDTSAPSITDNQDGDDTYLTDNSATYDVDFQDTGGAHLNQFQVRACSTNSNCGDVAGWTIVEKKIAADSYTTDWSLPDIVWDALPNGTSYISVRVFDGAGNMAEEGPVFYVVKTDDITPPATIATVNDGVGVDIDIASSYSQLSANWSESYDAETGIARYWYTIGTGFGATNTVDWTDNGTATSVTKTGLSLLNGVTYYFTVKAENGVGLQSVATYSDGQMVSISDVTPPSDVVSVYDGTIAGLDIDTTVSPSELSANWTVSSDAQSGVYRYLYAVGTTQGSTDIVGWTDNGTATSTTHTGLALTNNTTYYVSVKAENGVGLQSNASFSDGQTYTDATPPVFEGITALDSCGSLCMTLSWNAATENENSTPVTYNIYSAGISGSQNFTSPSFSTQGLSLDLSGLTEGSMYYFVVRAEDSVGNEDTNAVELGALATSISFTEFQTFQPSADTHAVAAGDVDADGDLDVALGNDYVANQVFLNDGSGNLTDTGQALSGTAKTKEILLIDVDSDGDLDMAEANYATGQTNRILLNDGTGTYTDSGQTLGSDSTFAMTSADLDGDGDLDLFAGNTSLGYGEPNKVYINDGTGTFTDSGQSLGSLVTMSVAAEDFDADGDMDVIAGNRAAGNVLWLNDGGGTFSDSGQSLGSGNTYAVTVLDADADGAADFAEGNIANEANRIWLNDGSGSFSDSGQALGNAITAGITSADLDGDGDTDLIAGNGVEAGDRIWVNDGSGNFLPTAISNGLYYTDRVFPADMDGDGDVDYLAASMSSFHPSILWMNDMDHANSTPAAPVLTTKSDFTISGETGQATLSWTAGSDAETPAALLTYDVRIGTSSQGCEVYCGYFPSSGATPWLGTLAGNAGAATSISINLGVGSYFWSVRTVDTTFKRSAWGTEDDFAISDADITPPADIATVNDGTGADIDVTDSATQLSANWSASLDAESGVSKYWYTIGTSPGATDTVDWTDNATATAVTHTGLSLSDGTTYYFAVKAENGAGLESNATISDGQMVDLSDITAPADIATVNDGTGADIDVTDSATQLSANWSASSDAESGVSKYWYTIGTSPGATDTVDWTDNGTATSVTHTGLSLSDGTTYYFAVKAENGAGLESNATISDGQTVVLPDTTPPVFAGLESVTGCDTGCATLSWQAASDAYGSTPITYNIFMAEISGGQNFSAPAYTATSTAYIVTGLTDGAVYYFVVRAEDSVGNEDTNTVEVAFTPAADADITPPSDIATVNDGLSADIDVTTDGTQLSANWTESSDAESGIAGYWYAIGTVADATDTVDWTDNATATAVTHTGLSLSNGTTYYFSVKAENGEGLFSAVTSSDGQTADLSDKTPPADIATVNDGGGTDIDVTTDGTLLSGNWSESSDPESGVARYWYGVGTSTGSVNFVDWTDIGLVTAATHTGLALVEGQTYYFAVKAENNEGLESTPVYSDGVLYARTEDEDPIVDPGDWNQVGSCKKGATVDFGAMFGSATVQIVTFDDGQFQFIPVEGTIELQHGRGYMVISQDAPATVITTDGVENQESTHTIELDQGWNLFSNPFCHPLAWGRFSVQLTCGGVVQEDVRKNIYAYNGQYAKITVDSGYKLLPWMAYWIYAPEAGCTLTLTDTK